MRDWRPFYAEEAGVYDARRYRSRHGRHFQRLHHVALARALGAAATRDRVLDVATGTGHALPVLTTLFGSVFALDLTAEMLRVAATNNPGPTLCVGSAFALPFADATFDAVTSTRFLHLFDDTARVRILRELARVARPRAPVVVDYYNASARRLLAPAVWVYRRLARKRPEHDAFLTVDAARAECAEAGLVVEDVRGVGSLLLGPVARASDRVVDAFARPFDRAARVLCEQFVVQARRA